MKLLNEDNLENKIKLLYLFDKRWLILVELNKIFFTFNRSEWQVNDNVTAGDRLWFYRRFTNITDLWFS